MTEFLRGRDLIRHVTQHVLQLKPQEQVLCPHPACSEQTQTPAALLGHFYDDHGMHAALRVLAALPHRYSSSCDSVEITNQPSAISDTQDGRPRGDQPLSQEGTCQIVAYDEDELGRDEPLPDTGPPQEPMQISQQLSPRLLRLAKMRAKRLAKKQARRAKELGQTPWQHSPHVLRLANLKETRLAKEQAPSMNEQARDGRESIHVFQQLSPRLLRLAKMKAKRLERARGVRKD